MNGKVAKRLRRAAYQTVRAQHHKDPWAQKEGYHPTLKRLRREYLALPYHRRKSKMWHIETHAEANARYHWRMSTPPS
jgi:hypothetical protein